MSEHVLTRIANRTGIITLDRPKALNSLSLDMVRALTAILLDWQHDAAVDAVVITSSSEKALCAGGDIRFFHDVGNACIGFANLLEATGFTADQCGYIGDDVIDLPLFARVGFAVAVPSGHPDVQHRAHYVTKNGGGRGAVREICDLVMRAQGTYDQALAPYFA